MMQVDVWGEWPMLRYEPPCSVTDRPAGCLDCVIYDVLFRFHNGYVDLTSDMLLDVMRHRATLGEAHVSRH